MSHLTPDSREQFVDDLRELWRSAGAPKFASLAARTGVGKTSLNDAVARRDRLPSARVVASLVGMLAPDDVDEWLARRTSLAPQPATEPQPPSGSRAWGPGEQRSPRRTPFIIAASFLIGILVGGGAVFLWIGGTTSGPRVEDGQDPALNAACIESATTALAQQVPGSGTLRLIYSPTCRAYWAKISREDGSAISNVIRVQVFEKDRPDHREQATEPDATTAYTMLLVRADPTSRFCATGQIVNQDSTQEFGPLC